jgi:CHAD domain-containing protein
MSLDSNYVILLSRKLRKLVRKRKSLTPDRVHKLRTTIRRLEAATATVSTKVSRREKACLRDLRRMRKEAGKVRDMDVLVADATSIRMATDSREELVQLVEHLGSERH